MPRAHRRAHPPGPSAASAIVIAAAALCAAPSLSGCLLFHNDQSCSDGPAADVSWTIANADGSPVTCDDAGATSVNLYFGGVKQTFPCGANSGTTRKLPAAGSYSARAELVAINGTVLADVPATPVSVDACGVTPIAPFAFVLPGTCASPPFVQVSWTIVDSTDTPIDCEAAGATSVVLALGSMTFSFQCGQYAAMTGDIEPGTYDASVTLVDAGGAVLSQADPMTVVVACGAPLNQQAQFIVNR